MTVGKLFKWIFGIIISFIIGFLLAVFFKFNTMAGFFTGVIWLYIVFFVIFRYKLVSHEKFDKLKKIEDLEKINNRKL